MEGKIIAVNISENKGERKKNVNKISSERILV